MKKPRDGWQASYKDPMRWKFPQDNTDYSISGTPRVDTTENDLCSTKVLVMHCPTHDNRAMSSGEYPFSWHLQDKRRNWEIRLQLRFKKTPERLFFGVELGHYVPVSGTARAVQKALVSACKKIVGDCYHSPGDDPSKTAGESETPSFVMPLWAFDQFMVSDPGSEPDLASDLSRVGMKRADGVKAYIGAMQQTIAKFSTDKVYTFCFWGISQFLDVIRWEICGSIFPIRIDFNKLCGKPPAYITMYDLPGMSSGDKDKRHLTSRKRRVFHVAAWTGPRPACLDGKVEDYVAEKPDDLEMQEEDLLQITKSLEELPDLISMDDFLGSPTPVQGQADNANLLDFDFFAPSTAPAKQEAAGYQAQKPKESDSVDLLGLM